MHAPREAASARPHAAAAAAPAPASAHLPLPLPPRWPPLLSGLPKQRKNLHIKLVQHAEQGELEELRRMGDSGAI
jgi:hypothetical protein